MQRLFSLHIDRAVFKVGWKRKCYNVIIKYSWLFYIVDDVDYLNIICDKREIFMAGGW